MKSKNKLNRFFFMMTCVFSTLLLIVSTIACYFAYNDKKTQFLTSMDIVYSQIDQEYENILNNFWQVYMPIFESKSTVYDVLKHYFTYDESSALSPQDKLALSEALDQMIFRDNRIEWIALYSDNRTNNYIKYSNYNVVNVISDSFPFTDDVNSKTFQMEEYGAKEVVTPNNTAKTFAICGGVPSGMGNGKILIGYRVNTFEAISNTSMVSFPSIRYYILSNDQVLYDSSGNYLVEELYHPEEVQNGVIKYNNSTLYVKSGYSGGTSTKVIYTVDWNEIFVASHEDTFWILAITLSFMIISILIHINMNRSVSKEVAVIQEGLHMITDNNLDFRLPTDFKQWGLPDIAENINEISSKLNENIKKAYYFEIKQKDAQLAQLQTTFNPHFLYNTLEMLRSKSYASGDEETAELISDLAAIFRSFIGAKTFITLKEELAFTKKYLTLLSARYGDTVKIRYDIDTSILNYGVIGNVYQLLIENYFVHGFDAQKENNFIRIRGKVSGENNMLLAIEDNGLGMSDEELANLKKKIQEPIRHGQSSYGLKNLNQRLKLFYGPDYGIDITKNDNNGLTVQIKIRKMEMSDYEKSYSEIENLNLEVILNQDF